jgi:serine/threonine protein kinase/Flp pilus assembly protein TadD
MHEDTTMTSGGDALIQGRILSHYRISQYIGRGGMGVVWKAEDLRLKRTVALKFPSDWIAPTSETLSRLQMEAQAAAALDHTAICTIYDIDQAEGLWFIAMAYIDGDSLRDRLRNGPLPPDEAVAIATQVIEGLEAAHTKNIVHCDIKSSNIMITRGGQAKILDFGIARVASAASMTAGVVLGTPSYMSPEQAQGIEVDHRTDLWSIGVVLYEMLSGKLPFRASSAADVLYDVVHGCPRPWEPAGESPQPALERIVAKALASELSARYQTASEMLADLRALRVEGTADPSVAVLPFVNLSADSENDYFSDGLADELINALAQIPGLRVVSRTSTFALKGKADSIKRVGELLQVDSVLEGSVRKSGSQLRITVQLVNVANERLVWAQKYDRELKDVFAIQEEIARQLVGSLKPKLLPETRRLFSGRYTENVHVYNLYLRGTYYLRQLTPAACELARGYLEQALHEEPDYPPALAAMAYYHYTLGAFYIVPPKDALPKALKFVLRALGIDNMLSEAHATLGDILMDLDWDWEGAEREMRRALELGPGQSDPHYSYMLLLMKLTRFDEASQQMQIALELDPLAVHLNSGLAYLYYYQGRYDSSLSACRKTIELDPNYFEIYGCLGLVYAEQNKFDEAIEAFEKARQLSGDHPVSLAFLAYTSALAGQSAKARELLDALLESSKDIYISPAYIALIYIGLRQFDEAFIWLYRACEARDFLLTFLRVLHTFDPLRADPRFGELLERLGLAAE